MPHPVVSLALSMVLGFGTAGSFRIPPALTAVPSIHQTERSMPVHARGTFEVQITPQPVDAYTDATTLGRMTIDKQFSGDLVGTGKGQMLTGMGTVKGSAAYSAIERVTGTMAGRQGSFVLQHTGVMAKGEQSLVITIVPDSGTDGFAGISGTLAIIIEGKKHSYDLEYTLPSAP
jgi:Protein of unknown function (DUF3224)